MDRDDAISKEIDGESSVKTLGVHWNPVHDNFTFSTLKFDLSPEKLTKRSVLSNIARLFDPLGWLSPITVTAKIIMQDLWINKCSWDEPLPDDIYSRWKSYCKSFTELPSLSIERWLGTSIEQMCEIHGFSDAFSRVYAAIVYLRIKESDECYRVSLLAAKTKVAPVKTVSISILELCGATLSVKLVCHLKGLDFLNALPIFLWSDSEIVLKWLKRHPCYWKTFVANRVSQIQTQLPEAIWKHVPSKQNPADLATRRATTLDLRDFELWWHGPVWLSQSFHHWPQLPVKAQVFHAAVPSTAPNILTRFSSLMKLCRITAYCLRPLNNLRRRKNSLDPLLSSLSASELAAARLCIIRVVQENAFAEEITLLKAGRCLLKGSPLSKLNPLLDKEQNILRVGGRLSHSVLTYERKHPSILPRRSAVSRLFIRHVHRLTLHGGPTLTLNVLLQHAWVIVAKQQVKNVIHNCIRCQRVKPRLAHQLMGDLPAARVTPARPFTTTGVDYAGPIQIRTTKGRGHRNYKGYIALFICFTTKAIHLEPVSDLTTPTFIAAYKRFVSRRGICRNLYSDNATTLNGADSEIQAMFTAASKFYKETAAALTNDGTAWKFIPPTTPHYGGLWEAGVKSTKHHLRRDFGEHSFTFEEFATILAEIEACLNSRPFCSLTTDIDDTNALTPAHFLIGDTSGFVPDEEPPPPPYQKIA